MKIMVALDGSEFAEAVIEPVTELAKAASARVFLVQVVEPSRVHGTWAGNSEYYEEAAQAEYTLHGARLWEMGAATGKPRPLESYDQALEQAIHRATDYLRDVASRLAPIQTEVVVLVGDDVDEQLASFARERKVDLIAMASHGRTGLARLAMGSHASNMLRYRVAPVMIVRPNGLHQAEAPTSKMAGEANTS